MCISYLTTHLAWQERKMLYSSKLSVTIPANDMKEQKKVDFLTVNIDICIKKKHMKGLLLISHKAI